MAESLAARLHKFFISFDWLHFCFDTRFSADIDISGGRFGMHEFPLMPKRFLCEMEADAGYGYVSERIICNLISSFLPFGPEST